MSKPKMCRNVTGESLTFKLCFVHAGYAHAGLPDAHAVTPAHLCSAGSWPQANPNAVELGETTQPECNCCSLYYGRACHGGECQARTLCDLVAGPMSSQSHRAGWWMGVLGSFSQKPLILWDKLP